MIHKLKKFHKKVIFQAIENMKIFVALHLTNDLFIIFCKVSESLMHIVM